MVQSEIVEKNIQKPSFVCVLTVWGETYTRLFLEIALPAQLSSGNLSALRAPSRYQIYTTVEDALRIRQHPVFKKLQQTMPVEIHFIEGKIENRYLAMSHCHKRAINDANSTHSALIFLTPDCVVSEGSLARAQQLADDGVGVVSTVGLRLKRDISVPLLKKYYNLEQDVINISSRDLMKLALDNLHSITQKHIWGGSSEMIPNNLFWNVQGEGLLGRCFHLHPLMVNPRFRHTKFKSTIDYDYPLSACPDPKDHCVIIDSDEVCICELTIESREMTGVTNGSMQALLDFAELQVNSNHLNNALQLIRMHIGEQTPEKWNDAINQSNQIFSDLQLELKSGAFKLLLSNPKRLIYRFMRREQEAAIVDSANMKNKWLIIALGKLARFIFYLYSRYIYRLVALVRRVLLIKKKHNLR